jgi:hypothetical protein
MLSLSRKISLLLIIIYLTNSCVKLNPEELNSSFTLNGKGLVLIGNEGNFQYGNASLSSYNKNSGEVDFSIYQGLNQSSLGDVLQSMSHIDHEIYLVINNSGKIVIVDDETLLYKREINQLVSPRKIIKVNSGKFHITDLYANSLYVYDSYNNSLTEIKVNGWCEDLLKHNGETFICNIANNQIYTVDIASNELTDSIPISGKPICIKEDNLNRLWILSRGNIQDNISSKITLIDPTTHLIIKSFSLTNNISSPSSLRINNYTNEVYFLNKHLYKLNSIEDSIPEIIWENTNENFRNLEIDPYNYDLFIADAKDYVQNGSIIILDNMGNFKKEISTEIIPNSMLF